MIAGLIGVVCLSVPACVLLGGFSWFSGFDFRGFGCDFSGFGCGFRGFLCFLGDL